MNPRPSPLYTPLSRFHMSFVHNPLSFHFSSLISHCHDLHLPTPMAACLHHNSPPVSCDPNTLHTSDPHLTMVKFCRPTLSDHHHSSSLTISPNPLKIDSPSDSDLWFKIREEALADVEDEPILSNYYVSMILTHNSIDRALANHLSIKLCNSSLPSSTLFQLFSDVLRDDGGEILRCAIRDLRAVKERDPASVSYVQCFLNYKGFLAVQSHRIAHKLWSQGRKVLASLIQNRVSEAFAIDIHPGAKIGYGVFLDHATGVVVGETAVIGNDVSILHHVTLGGTGKDSGDRHPKIGDGVLIGAGTCILGNIRIGEGAKIGAGSVVLKDVPPRTTAVGNPARLVGGKANPVKLDKTPSFTMDHTSHISGWSDYVI